MIEVFLRPSGKSSGGHDIYESPVPVRVNSADLPPRFCRLSTPHVPDACFRARHERQAVEAYCEVMGLNATPYAIEVEWLYYPPAPDGSAGSPEAFYDLCDNGDPLDAGE